MWQKIVSIGSGTITGLLVIMIGTVVVFNLFPFPENLEWLNIDDRNTYIASIPARGLKAFIFSHAIGCFLAGLVASLIAKKQQIMMGLIAFGLCFLYILNDLWRICYPDWFYYFNLFISALSGIIGSLLGSRA